MDIVLNTFSNFLIKLHFFTIVILTSYLSGTQPSLIKIINSSYGHQKISFDDCIDVIASNSNAYIDMKNEFDTNNQFLPPLNSEAFLRHFEWVYIPHITGNNKIYAKLIHEDTNKPTYHMH